MQSRIAVVGLATMGQNLALNIARNGFPVTVFNRSFGKTEATMARVEAGQRVTAAKTPQDVAASLERPRRLLLLVKAGQPVDDTIATFLPSSRLAAGLPRVTMTFGRTARICPSRKGLQALTSGGSGLRFRGGRHFTMLQM